MFDLKKDNKHLIDTLDEAKKQLQNSTNECDSYRIKNKCADDNLISLTIELENMKQHTSEITLCFEKELTNLNKSLNDICHNHNEIINAKEKEYQNKCYNHELDKTDKISEFKEIRK